jgi:hypothetical protein
MFGTYLKSSLGVLPWLLMPVACYCLFIMGINPYYIQDYTIAENVVGFTWGPFAAESIGYSLIISIITHITFLLLIPTLIGGADALSKRFEFYIGFFINLAFTMSLPLYFTQTFGLDGTTFVILLVLHAFMFVITFIIASRFVSPVYRRAFWFTYSN